MLIKSNIEELHCHLDQFELVAMHNENFTKSIVTDAQLQLKTWWFQPIFYYKKILTFSKWKKVRGYGRSPRVTNNEKYKKKCSAFLLLSFFSFFFFFIRKLTCKFCKLDFLAVSCFLQFQNMSGVFGPISNSKSKNTNREDWTILWIKNFQLGCNFIFYFFIFAFTSSIFKLSVHSLKFKSCLVFRKMQNFTLAIFCDYRVL